jgi:hypothetical protein
LGVVVELDFSRGSLDEGCYALTISLVVRRNRYAVGDGDN